MHIGVAGIEAYPGLGSLIRLLDSQKEGRESVASAFEKVDK
jgi:hypothetical protein